MVSRCLRGSSTGHPSCGEAQVYDSQYIFPQSGTNVRVTREMEFWLALNRARYDCRNTFPTDWCPVEFRFAMMIAPNSRTHKGEVKEEYGGIWGGEEEGNTDYGGMVQPSQQHVAPCVKVVEWGFDTRCFVTKPVRVSQFHLGRLCCWVCFNQ